MIQSYDMFIVTEGRYFSRGNLSGQNVNTLSHGGPLEHHEVTTLDYQLLKALSVDSKQPYNSLATKLKCSPATVRYRIERLERLGIIAMYRIDLNVHKLGLVFFKAQFYLKNYSAMQEEEFIAYCSRNLKVLFLLKQIGSCKLEIELEVADFEQYHELIDDLRTKFHNFIKSVETIVIRKHRYSSVPNNIYIVK
jgi:DNA-binding Lrp family transcriptional regulator